MPSEHVRPSCEVGHHPEHVILGNEWGTVETTNIPAQLVLEGLADDQVGSVQMKGDTRFHHVTALKTTDRSIGFHRSAKGARAEIFEWVVNWPFENLMLGGCQHFEQLAQLAGGHHAFLVVVHDPRLPDLPVPAGSASLYSEMQTACFEFRSVGRFVINGEHERRDRDRIGSEGPFDVVGLAQ